MSVTLLSASYSFYIVASSSKGQQRRYHQHRVVPPM